MRLHLFEFEDQPWFPNTIRESMTDTLRYFFNTTGFYKPVIPLIANALKQTDQSAIVDLCSGAGGNIEQIYEGLKKEMGAPVSILLTDKFPNLSTWQYLKDRTKGEINFSGESLDATNLPDDIKGFRTMFTASHHFKPEMLKRILKNAADKGQGIGLFDGGDKNIFSIIGIILLQPFIFLIFTPFFKPFKWSRLFFTYIIPLIPLCTMWDGVASIMRLYQPNQFLKMAKEVNPEYNWQAGKVKGKTGLKVTFLIGYPFNK